MHNETGLSMRSRRLDRLSACRRVFAVVLLAVTPLSAMPVEVDTSGDIAELKRKYLACDREATTRRLGPGEAQGCSLVAEALLRRGFEGDFERLLLGGGAAGRAPHPSLKKWLCDEVRAKVDPTRSRATRLKIQTRTRPSRCPR